MADEDCSLSNQRSLCKVGQEKKGWLSLWVPSCLQKMVTSGTHEQSPSYWLQFVFWAVVLVGIWLKLLGVCSMSLFWSKLFLCLYPAEYWVWHQLLALLLPQPGRCWDVHSTDILQAYDINWFQAICTIFFPSGTSKYAWSVSNSSSSSLKILQCSSALLNDLFSMFLSVKGSTEFSI